MSREALLLVDVPVSELPDKEVAMSWQPTRKFRVLTAEKPFGKVLVRLISPEGHKKLLPLEQFHLDFELYEVLQERK